MKLFLSRIHFPITSLGPGKRIGIWFQGCSIRCIGCISEDTWRKGIGETTVQEVMQAIQPWVKEADGITISGGEPFDQLDALGELLTEVRACSSGDVLVFSGYSLSFLRDALSQMPGLIDALVSEPYDHNEQQTLPLRGSDNQIVHRLTPLGESLYVDVDDSSKWKTNSLDLMFDGEDTFWIAGIPQRGDMQRLRKILESNGIESATSEHKGKH